MIATTELRLGNWIANKNGTIQQIISITRGKLWADGIEINTYILQKCGFELYEDKHKSKSWRFDAFKFSFTDTGELKCFLHRTEVPCKYLHQLQNIYYAFKGVELVVNLVKF